MTKRKDINRMKIIFIAGPFRGKTHWDVLQNVRKAEETALKVAEFGAMPLCPHNNSRNFDGLLTDKFWLEGTLELLRRCDGVIMGEGWQSSTGSINERNEAGKLEIPIFYSLDKLKIWLGNEEIQEENKET